MEGVDGSDRGLHERSHGTAVKDWLVRGAFAVAGLLLVWLLPDPWDQFTSVAAVVAFIWMVVVAARRGPSRPRRGLPPDWEPGKPPSPN